MSKNATITDILNTEKNNNTYYYDDFIIPLIHQYINTHFLTRDDTCNETSPGIAYFKVRKITVSKKSNDMLHSNSKIK